jgi:hypothetical protein
VEVGMMIMMTMTVEWREVFSIPNRGSVAWPLTSDQVPVIMDRAVGLICSQNSLLRVPFFGGLMGGGRIPFW